MSLKRWIILIAIAVIAVAAAIVVTFGWIGLVVFAISDALALLIASKLQRSGDWTGVIQPNCRRRDLMSQLEEGSVTIVDGEVRLADEERKADS